MKTIVISLFAATLLGFATLMSNESVDAGVILAIAFATGLVAWTVSEYDNAERLPERRAKTIPFVIPGSGCRVASTGSRLAA